jgi:hypothetical protein
MVFFPPTFSFRKNQEKQLFKMCLPNSGFRFFSGGTDKVKQNFLFLVVLFLFVFHGSNLHFPQISNSFKDPIRDVTIASPPSSLEKEEIKNDSNLSGFSIFSSPPPFQEGWPITTEGRIDSSPAIGDLDNDGDFEVIFGSFDNQVYALHHDGTPVDGWPKTLGDIVVGSAGLVDLKQDGFLEVFIGSSLIYGFTGNGNYVPGWPQLPIDGFFIATPSLENLVNTETNSIIVGTNRGIMNIWQENGVIRQGWPKNLNNIFARIISAASTGDLTGNGNLEIAIGTQDSRFFLWDQSGELLPGFPLEIGARVNGESAIGDIDDDGELEIAFATEVSSLDKIAKIFVLNADSTNANGWPIEVANTVNGGVALGDLDRDGKLELSVCTIGGSGFVYLWNGESGTPLPGWPQVATNTSFNTNPVFGDIDGNGIPDLIAVGTDATTLNDSLVWAWNLEGFLLEGFPFRVPNFRNVFSSPTLTDLDGDGDLELGFGTENPFSGFLPARMFFFDLPSPYDPLTMEWPTLSHDFQRTGRYSPPGKEPVFFEVSIRQPFLSLQHTPALLIIEVSFEADPSGPFAITKLDGLEIEPIEEETPGIAPPGRPGLRILRFDARVLAEAILDVKTDASQVILTLRAPIDEQKELVGEVILPLR